MQAPQKILIINHYAGSTRHGMEFRPFYLAWQWNLMGHESLIVGASFSHLRSLQPEKSFESVEGVRFEWIRTNQYSGNGFWRLISLFLFIIQLFLKVPRYTFFSPTVVIASSTYPLDIFPCWLIARLSKAKLIFELHDLWPLSPQELGSMGRYHPFIQLMAIGEYFSYKLCDQVVSILPNAFEHVKKFQVKKENFTIVSNGVDLAVESNRKNPGEVAKKIAIQMAELRQNPANFLLCYAGAHGPANALQTVLNALVLLAQVNLEVQAKVHMFFIGDGACKADLQAKAIENLDTKIYFYPKMSKFELMPILEQMDALIITLQNRPLFRYGVAPNKIFDYMLAGRPIISAMGIETSHYIIDQFQCGLSCEAESPEALAQVLMQMMALPPAERDAMGFRGRTAVLEHFTYEQLAKDFASIFA